MGSYDGAEIYELVGLYQLLQLQNLNINVGLYRDDGRAVTKQTRREAEMTKKKLCRIFEDWLASFCLGRQWVCALVVISWSSCNGDCGCRAQSASGRSSSRSGTQRLCRLRYPMLPSLVCAASSSRVALSVSVLF